LRPIGGGLGIMKEKMVGNLWIMETKMGAMGWGWSKKGFQPTKTFKNYEWTFIYEGNS